MAVYVPTACSTPATSIRLQQYAVAVYYTCFRVTSSVHTLQSLTHEIMVLERCSPHATHLHAVPMPDPVSECSVQSTCHTHLHAVPMPDPVSECSVQTGPVTAVDCGMCAMRRIYHVSSESRMGCHGNLCVCVCV